MTRPAPSRKPRAAWNRWLERSLWLAAVLALAWVGWGWLDGRIYQRRQERLLEEALTAPLERDGSEEPSGILPDELAVGEGPPGAGSAPLDALGRIVVPRLDMAVMVADGIDSRTLRRGAGHIPGTSRLGSGGNVGIAGHRDSFFRPLKDVRAGDEVVVTTPGAISRYRVEWAEVVAPGDTSSLRPTPYSALTLVTCYPFHYIGAAPDRFVVRARLVESRAATAADAELLGGGRRGG